MKVEKELSGVLTPCRIESGRGDLECGLARCAGDVYRGLVEELSLEGVVLRTLKKGLYSACEAICTKPVRWLAVCAIRLQCIGRKTGSWRYQLISLRVGIELFRLSQFFLKLCNLCEEKLVLAEKVEIRALRIKELRLKVADGCFDLGVLREVEDVLGRQYEVAERACGSCGHRCDCRGVHGESPFHLGLTA